LHLPHTDSAIQAWKNPLRQFKRSEVPGSGRLMQDAYCSIQYAIQSGHAAFSDFYFFVPDEFAAALEAPGAR
jgi:hypothetical protein